MKNINKCPFLEEIVVRCCKAYPIKKLIPINSLKREDPCIGCPEKCSTYQEVAQNPPQRHGVYGENIKSRTSVDSVTPWLYQKDKELTMKDVKQEKQCIWMKAGVIAYRVCTSNYDCKDCEFDQTLMDQGGGYGESPMIKEAIAKLRTMPADKRKCRYMLTSDISYKLCPNNYECWHCSVDQMVQDIIDSNPLLAKKRAKKQETPEKIRGFTFHPSVYYLPNHVWVKIEKDNEVKVGLDDFATKLLGEITKVLIPKEHEDADVIKIEQRQKSFRIPVNRLGNVVKTNADVLANPESVIKDPYNKGWLFTIESSNIFDNLKDAHKGPDAKKWFVKEIDSLQETIQQECGVTIADGGELVSDVKERISENTLQRLIKKFLKVE